MNTEISRFLLAIVLMMGAPYAIAQGAKIGFVNPVRIENESVQFVRAMESLKKEFEPRTKPITELQKQITDEKERYQRDLPKLSESDALARRNALAAMMRKSDQLVEAITDDFERRKAERAVKLVAEVNSAIKAVAEAGNYDLIVQQVTFAGKTIDITDLVLKELAKRAGGKP